MSRSTAALLIAIMFHLLLIILFKFLLSFELEKPKKPQEHRIKIALKEKPKNVHKSAAVKNRKKPLEKLPPIPKGKQLKKPVKLPKAQPKTKPQQIPKKKPVKKQPAQKQVKKQIIKKIKQPEVPTKKQVYTSIKKTSIEDLNSSKKPKKKSALYASLSKKQPAQKQVKIRASRGSRVGGDFKEAYGDAFGKLSEGEIKYLIDNQERMRQITQQQLNRLAPVNIPRNLHISTMNTIEFYLHPNGDISGLRVISPSGKEILDDTSLQTIEYSYHRYPYPKQKTLIRYNVAYHLDTRRP